MVFHRVNGKIMGAVFAVWIVAGMASVAAAQGKAGTTASSKKPKSVMKQITEKVIETVTGKEPAPQTPFSNSLNEGAEKDSGEGDKEGSNVLKEAFKKLVETPGDKKKKEEAASAASSPVNNEPVKPARPKTAKKEEDKGIIEKTLDVLISPGEDKQKPAPPAAKSPVKAAKKKAPAAKPARPAKPKVTTAKKEESNIIHETLKNIISPSDDKKEPEVAQNSLKPVTKGRVKNSEESSENPKEGKTNVLKEAFKKLVATPGDEKQETPQE